jgi:hypothetical protein
MAVQGTATAHDDFPVVCLNKHPIGYRAIRWINRQGERE